MTVNDLNPYVALVLVAFLPNEIWRVLGVIVGHAMDESSELLIWVRAVATGVLAGVIAQLVITPPGVLATVPLAVRCAAIVIGFVAFLGIRRSVFAGVVTGEAALIIGALIYPG